MLALLKLSIKFSFAFAVWECAWYKGDEDADNDGVEKCNDVDIGITADDDVDTVLLQMVAAVAWEYGVDVVVRLPFAVVDIVLDVKLLLKVLLASGLLLL